MVVLCDKQQGGILMRQRVTVLSRDELKKDTNKRHTHSFLINKPAQEISHEEEQQMLVDLFEDLHSDRIQHERRMEESMNFAKNYYSK